MKERILFIDAYDSFSNNIVSLLETNLDVIVTQVKIDTQVKNLSSFLKPYSAIVAGPGPGNPGNHNDIGLIKELWTLPNKDVLPVLGICLGFQSLVLAFGGKVVPLGQARHGIVTRIFANTSEIFDGIEEVQSVQYHSLHGSLGHETLSGIRNSPNLQYLWQAHESCPSLVPLAWETSHPITEHEDTELPQNPTNILMAVKHVSNPFYGIQFHPESICSEPSAAKVILNWWNLVKKWHVEHRRPATVYSELAMHAPELSYIRSLPDPTITPPESRSLTPTSISSSPSPPGSSVASSISEDFDGPGLPAAPSLKYLSMDKEDLTVPELCQLVGSTSGDMIVLDSEMRQMPEVGIYSIIGIVDVDTIKIKYTTGNSYVEIQCGKESIVESLHGGTNFTYLKKFMDEHRVDTDRPSLSPFEGGLMGYITYEACLETIDVHLRSSPSDRPDICFAYVERSIVINHETNKMYVQSIKQDDSNWLKSTYGVLCAARGTRQILLPYIKQQATPIVTNIELPLKETYKGKIRDCKSHIAAGNSYELCLTGQTTVHTTKIPNQAYWPQYLRLRRLNPAPFSAYIRLGALTLLSTSPERFMSWSRPDFHGGISDRMFSTCQFRPIKGTVKKQHCDSQGNLGTVSLAEATKTLSTTKEQAENLMIVDLIRHDLHGVVGSGNVKVKALMSVEEYETVFQLVSVIEGTLETPVYGRTKEENCTVALGLGEAPRRLKQGIDVLAASLPPGSMTGAPKRRSCELLQTIEEHRPRSIYSGVVGYVSVSGDGDFSVVIRSVFKWDRQEEGDLDAWTIGAGGAVTGLSTEEGEWEEMVTKIKSTLGLFVEPDR